MGILRTLSVRTGRPWNASDLVGLSFAKKETSLQQLAALSSKAGMYAALLAGFWCWALSLNGFSRKMLIDRVEIKLGSIAQGRCDRSSIYVVLS